MPRSGIPRTRHLRHRRLGRMSRTKNFINWLSARVTALSGTGATSNFTTTNATNDVNSTAHGFVTGDGPLVLTNSGGSLPTGYAVTTPYFVIYGDANTFKLAESLEAAKAGIAVAISDDGSGTHSYALKADANADIYDINRKGNRPVTIDALTDIDNL